MKLKKFEYDIRNKYKDYDLVVYLCYDTDVFYYNAKPAVNWEKVENRLIELGAKNVYHIKAEKCIEDVFLIDLKGVCKYLNIPEVKSVNGKDGVEKMKNLFLKGNRIYQKGFSCEDFISSLNMSLILKERYDMFKSLIKELADEKVSLGKV